MMRQSNDKIILHLQVQVLLLLAIHTLGQGQSGLFISPQGKNTVLELAMPLIYLGGRFYYNMSVLNLRCPEYVAIVGTLVRNEYMQV